MGRFMTRSEMVDEAVRRAAPLGNIREWMRTPNMLGGWEMAVEGNGWIAQAIRAEFRRIAGENK